MGPVGRPEGVGPSLEREKTGDRDRGETGPERAAKRKRHVALQRVTRGVSEREGEEDIERWKQRYGGRIREEEPEVRRV